VGTSKATRGKSGRKLSFVTAQFLLLFFRPKGF
jgi:hypothetical protein